MSVNKSLVFLTEWVTWFYPSPLTVLKCDGNLNGQDYGDGGIMCKQTLKLCLHVAFACASVSTFGINFCIESIVMQMLMQRTGLNPFSVFAISTMLKLAFMLTQIQTLRVNLP